MAKVQMERHLPVVSAATIENGEAEEPVLQAGSTLPAGLTKTGGKQCYGLIKAVERRLLSVILMGESSCRD
jgi:hypothetical protein